MYKKIFMGIAAVAALTLVSCSSDDLNSLSDNSSKNEAISFDGYLGRSAVAVNGSRGSALTKDALQKSTEGFGVFGNYSEKTETLYGNNLFENEQVTYDKSTTPAKWTYTNTKYWPTEGHIDFLAYAPYGETPNFNGSSSIDFTVEKDAAAQKDLLWAKATNQTKAENSGTSKVKFTFKHALAKIGYKVKTSASYEGTTIKLNKITLAGSATEPTKTAFYKEGTINLSTGAWTPSTSEEKQNFEWFTNTSGTVVTTEAADNDPGNYLFVIPQKFSTPATDELYVIVEYTIQTGTTAMKSIVSSKITKDFEQGKAYTINLFLGLTPIEFDVTTVEGWTDTNQGEISSWN